MTKLSPWAEVFLQLRAAEGKAFLLLHLIAIGRRRMNRFTRWGVSGPGHVAPGACFQGQTLLGSSLLATVLSAKEPFCCSETKANVFRRKHSLPQEALPLPSPDQRHQGLQFPVGKADPLSPTVAWLGTSKKGPMHHLAPPPSPQRSPCPIPISGQLAGPVTCGGTRPSGEVLKSTGHFRPSCSSETCTQGTHVL